MQTSEHINEIAEALAKAQGEIQDPPKKHMNPHFKKPYADMTDGLGVIRPALSKHGIAIVQATEIDGGNVFLLTRLVHKSGQWVGSSYPVGATGAHQTLAANLTYAKRQTLFALVGVHGDDDDDGNSATEAPAGRARQEATTRPSAETKARAEAETYTERAIIAIGDIDSMDRLNVWWKAEEKNRHLHFTSKDDPLLTGLKAAAAKRGAELADPVQEAAE